MVFTFCVAGERIKSNGKFCPLLVNQLVSGWDILPNKWHTLDNNVLMSRHNHLKIQSISWISILTRNSCFGCKIVVVSTFCVVEERIKSNGKLCPLLMNRLVVWLGHFIEQVDKDVLISRHDHLMIQSISWISILPRGSCFGCKIVAVNLFGVTTRTNGWIVEEPLVCNPYDCGCWVSNTKHSSYLSLW